MSLFLGFIHHLMYDKILFLENLNERLINFAKNEGYDDVVLELSNTPKVEKGNLEDIIDNDNIHGWLDERVVRTENRFAKVVNLLIEKSQDNKEKVLKTVSDVADSFDEVSNPAEAFGKLNSLFLDGMPCDGAISIVNEDENRLVFQVVNDMHYPIWCFYGNEKFYWEIREAFTKRFLEKSSMSFNKLRDGLYEIC